MEIDYDNGVKSYQLIFIKIIDKNRRKRIVMNIYFLGGGNMASAIIQGLQRQQVNEPIFVASRNPDKRLILEKKFNITTSDKLPELSHNDILILAVKPQDMEHACSGIQTNGALVLSLAAGLNLKTLSRYLNGHSRMIRVMPNTPAAIGFGISGLFADTSVSISEDDKQCAERIMRAVGEVVWLEHEEQLHTLTAVSGSGPAYIFYLMNAMKQAAENLGLSEELAYQLSLNTFKGATLLAEHSKQDFSVLQEQVTSKGGTTFAALSIFNKKNVGEHIGLGIQAAKKRSEELSQLFE